MKNIDFHAHILPKADHGSDSLETSLKQIELSASANIDIIIATPHFYPHRHSLESFIKKRNESYSLLKDNSNFKVILGAEVLLCDNIDRLENLDALCIENTKILLIELPFSDFRNEYITSVERLISNGYTVVLAHVERYPKENIEKLISLGALLQCNASAFSKIFIKGHIKKWLKEGLIVALGSDIHKADTDAYKKVIKAKKKLADEYENIMKKTETLLYEKNQAAV